MSMGLSWRNIHEILGNWNRFNKDITAYEIRFIRAYSDLVIICVQQYILNEAIQHSSKRFTQYWVLVEFNKFDELRITIYLITLILWTWEIIIIESFSFEWMWRLLLLVGLILITIFFKRPLGILTSTRKLQRLKYIHKLGSASKDCLILGFLYFDNFRLNPSRYLYKMRNTQTHL